MGYAFFAIKRDVSLVSSCDLDDASGNVGEDDDGKAHMFNDWLIEPDA